MTELPKSLLIAIGVVLLIMVCIGGYAVVKLRQGYTKAETTLTAPE